jgi:hypothetical protein
LDYVRMTLTFVSLEGRLDDFIPITAHPAPTA